MPLLNDKRSQVLAQAVLRTLEEAGYLCGDLEALDFQREVYEAGEAHLEQLRQELKPEPWRVLRRAFRLPNAYANLGRIMGFGGMMASYILAAHPQPKAHRAELVYLGALSNLIITLFDFLVDEQVPSPAGIAAVKQLVKGQKPTGTDLEPEWALLTEMIGLYLQKLVDETPEPMGDPVLRMQFKVIRKMLRAELGTVESTGAEVPEEKILQKSYLPFVILGLPGQLGHPEPVDAGYLDWMTRLGKCIGILDDLVDLEDDFKSGDANVLLHRWGGLLPTQAQFEAATTEWGQELKACFAYWEWQVAAEDHVHWLPYAPALAVISWMNGLERLEAAALGLVS